MPFQLELTRPLCLLGILAIPVLVYYFYRSLSDFPRRQRIASLALRALIVLLMVLSLAGLTLLRPTSEQFVVFLVDESLSVGDESVQRARGFLADAMQHVGAHRAAVLPFAKQPAELQTEDLLASQHADAAADPTAAASESAPPAAESPDGSASAGQGTNIAAAIEAAAGAMPPGYVPKIVLLSDGNENEGSALTAALRAEIPISTVPLPTRSDPEVQVSAVRVPAQVREGEPFFIDIVVDSNHDDRGRLRVFRGAYSAIDENVELKKGENKFRFQHSFTGERLASFTARIEDPKPGDSGPDGDAPSGRVGGAAAAAANSEQPASEFSALDDTLLDNNAESALVFAAGKPRVLIIESDQRLIRQLTYALEEEGIGVEVRGPTGMPESLADLQNFELLILSNVPATDLTQRQMELARTYVQELGGGLLMLGGEQSFGLGGYYKSVLEEILPVRSDFEKEREKPSLGMMLVIDKSGSMNGEKIEMAKSAARSAAELLASRDQLGVLAFDGGTFVISELQSASNKGRISDEISRIDAGGGTNMYPAMEQAYEMLRETSARLKHVIILTDGISSPGDFEGLAQTMAGERMTVTTVGVGSGADAELLEEIARVGQGRYYFTDDPASVPQIFAKETMTASKSAIDEQPFIPQVIRTTQALADIDMETAPFLLGFVKTRPKPTSEVILATESGDPLLSWWRYGLGMSAAFTSDAKSRWAAEWLTWPDFSRFWAQVVRQIMRRGEVTGLQVEIRQDSGRAELIVDAIDETGRFLNRAETEVTLIDPRLATQKIALSQTAPGRYVTEFETPLPGAYHLELTQKLNGQLIHRQSRGLMVGYRDELRLRPTNDELLAAIAASSGGQHAIRATDCFAASSETAHRPTPLWPWLVSMAAALFVIDVGLRRIDLSLFRTPGPTDRFETRTQTASPG